MKHNKDKKYDKKKFRIWNQVDANKKWNSLTFSSYTRYISQYTYKYKHIYLYKNTHIELQNYCNNTHSTVTVFKEYTTFMCRLNIPNK